MSEQLWLAPINHLRAAIISRLIGVRPRGKLPSTGFRSVTATGATCLGHESDLPLMSDRKHAHLVLRDDEPVQRDVPCLAERNHELPNVAVNARPEQRVRGQALDGRADGPGRRDGRVRVLACQELESALEVRQCPR